jgi:hypothetical protein
MIKMSELQPGDIVMAEYEGQMWEGTVEELNKEDREVCVKTAIQEFWFKPEALHPIPLNEEQLLKLGFQRVANEDGSVKYKKDSFRVLVPAGGDFNHLEIWWREDRRHLHNAIYVHELQNHHYQMTKVELNPA